MSDGKGVERIYNTRKREEAQGMADIQSYGARETPT
jgi:hypothetical protein